MLLIIREKASKKELEKMAKHFEGFIKLVIDVDQEILCGGADRHSDEEKELLEQGSKQENLWGGGLDLETKGVDYNSIINLRPNQENPSRDILSAEIRKRFDKIIKRLLL
ncbi:MAG: DUF5674 family protein [Microgenomates group bacterium]